jgi:two-component system, chemotaxis family, chemotaxis protein CheY
MPKILVIDDSPSALQVIAMTLAAAGYETCTCSDGKIALAALRSEAFDLIVTDIYMPEKDGLEVIQEGHRIGPNIPIIAMSGMTGERSMLAAAKLMGACRTLEKPLSQTGLLAAVGAALSEHSVPPPTSGFRSPRRQDNGLRK